MWKPLTIDYDESGSIYNVTTEAIRQGWTEHHSLRRYPNEFVFTFRVRKS